MAALMEDNRKYVQLMDSAGTVQLHKISEKLHKILTTMGIPEAELNADLLPEGDALLEKVTLANRYGDPEGIFRAFAVWYVSQKVQIGLREAVADFEKYRAPPPNKPFYRQFEKYIGKAPSRYSPKRGRK